MYEDYPEEAEIFGKIFKINTDYRYGLAAFNAIEDEELNDTTRAIAVVTILFGQEDKNGNIINVPDENAEMLEKALYIAGRFLCCGKEPKNPKLSKKDMDFNYDNKYINASFLSDYRIDIEEVKMHWWKYCNLIAGFTDNCVLSKIRDIRNIDLNDYKDAKQKAKLKEAMENVALPIKYSVEEQKEIDEFEALFLGDDKVEK